MPPLFGHIFISYSRTDEAIRRRVVDFLREKGLQIWVDDERLVPGSPSWQDDIEKGIDGAAAVVVLLSPDAKKSLWVKREINMADQKRKQIFPLLVRGDQVEAVPFLLVTNQYVDIRQHEKAGLNALFEALSQYLADPESLSKGVGRPATRAAGSLRKKLIATILGLSALAVGAWGFNSLLAMNQRQIPPTPTLPVSSKSVPGQTHIPTVEPASNATEVVTTDYPATRNDFKNVPMILIPAGEFTMGNNLEQALSECRKLRPNSQEICIRDNFIDETPAHLVVLDSFYIDKYEVSNGRYQQCVDEGTCSPPAQPESSSDLAYYGRSQYSNFPVTHVSWEMAKDYCEWRNGSLPTEAQWEKAARGVSATTYPWGNIFNDLLANTCDVKCRENIKNPNINDGFADIAPVDAFADGTTALGVFNLAGNVAEWVADWYAPNYYSTVEDGVVNPPGPQVGQYKGKRGSSWGGYEVNLRSTSRLFDTPNTTRVDLGFRCVAPVP